MEAKTKHIIYKEEFRCQAVKMVIRNGKTEVQVARELFWKLGDSHLFCTTFRSIATESPIS